MVEDKYQDFNYIEMVQRKSQVYIIQMLQDLLEK